MEAAVAAAVASDAERFFLADEKSNFFRTPPFATAAPPPVGVAGGAAPPPSAAAQEGVEDIIAPDDFEPNANFFLREVGLRDVRIARNVGVCTSVSPSEPGVLAP